MAVSSQDQGFRDVHVDIRRRGGGESTEPVSCEISRGLELTKWPPSCMEYRRAVLIKVCGASKSCSITVLLGAICGEIEHQCRFDMKLPLHFLRSSSWE